MNALVFSPVKLFRKARNSLDRIRTSNNTVKLMEDLQSLQCPSSTLSKSLSLPVLPSLLDDIQLSKRLSLTVNENDNEDNAEEYFNIFKWIDQTILPENEAKNLRDIIEDELLHLQSLVDADIKLGIGYGLRIDIALKFEAFSIISKKLTLAYLNILLRKYMEAKSALRCAKRFLKKCWKNQYILRDYVSGISFVILTLEEFYMQQMETDIDQISVHLISCPKSSTELWIPTFGGVPVSGYMSKYHSLSEKSQVAVLGIKYYVMEIFGKDISQRISLLNYMLTKDAQYFEWYMCLATCLRSQRHNSELNKAFIPSPSVRERESVKISITLNPLHPMCLLNECIYVAEISKTHNWGSHLLYGDIILKNADQLDEFLHCRWNKIVQSYNWSSSINIGLSELFTYYAPNKDFRLAKEILDWDLFLHPKCGKALYHLGMYYLQSEEKNLEKASSYFIRGFESDQRLFSGLVELLNIYLKDAPKYGERIMAIISKYIKNPLSGWNQFHHATLLFIEGCYLYMDQNFGGVKNAVLCWISCYQMCESTWKYKISTFPHGDYQPKLTLSNIKAAILEQTRFHHISEQEKVILRRMATGSYWYPWSQKRFAIA